MKLFAAEVNFNPLPRKRENKGRKMAQTGRADFNPLPRKRENYVAPKVAEQQATISIHSLVRGRTAERCTKRSRLMYFNPLPRKRENLAR